MSVKRDQQDVQRHRQEIARLQEEKSHEATKAAEAIQAAKGAAEQARLFPTSPEVRAQALFRDRFIGVVRMGHALTQGEITPARYAAGRHICVSRRGLDRGPIDEALEPLGLEREIIAIVDGFATALALARASDLIASVPERHTGSLRAGMHNFPLPVSTPEITISLLWHPRMDSDPAHRWLRGHVRNVCAAIR